MAYTPTTWKDHLVTSQAVKITENSDGTFIITPAGKVIQQGTKMSADNFNHMEQEIAALSSEAETYYKKSGGTIGGNTELTQTVIHNQNTIPLIVRRGNTTYGSQTIKFELGDGSAEGTKTQGYLQWGADGNFSVRNSSNDAMLTITSGGRLVVNYIKTKSGLLLADVSNTNASEPLTATISEIINRYTSLKVDAVLSNTDGNIYSTSFILPVGYVAEGNTYMHSCRGYATKTVFFDSCISCTISGSTLSFKQIVPGGGYVSGVKIFSL
ncbi:MAG: hypothetical protein K2G62_03355 [Oscillospiraceae bacterium]|nr:hypothetical protein [Oscillospiraceae bacterium]